MGALANTLISLKQAFFLPLAPLRASAALAKSGPEQVPSASSHVSLHDNHNIEIKTVSELGSKRSVVETDLFLFVPRSFEIQAYGKEELIKDFRTRVRLALPVSGDQGVTAFESALRNLIEKKAQLEAEEGAGFGDSATEGMLEAAKDLCAVLAETLKHRSAEHVRAFFLSHSLIGIPRSAVNGLEQLAAQVSAVSLLIERMRAVRSEDCSEAAAMILMFLDEYASHLYVQYLSSIRYEVARIAPPKGHENDLTYAHVRDRFETLLDSTQEKEARHRFAGRSDEESDLDREQRLVRLSHLKKFFQSKTFVDITRKRMAKKVSESTATIGTAIAGFSAALIERYGRPEIGDVATQGALLLFFGVVLYVLRDRLKDWAKQRFHETAMQLLPDFEQHLVARDRKIGTVKEWFRLAKVRDLPKSVFDLRGASSANEMERRLPEDIFHCRKVQDVNVTIDAHGHVARSLHENTRVNFERYLKHMDDPFKCISDLDSSGRFMQSRSHRVYHFYLCVRTMTRSSDTNVDVTEQVNAYRIVLDKTGVLRIESPSSERLS